MSSSSPADDVVNKLDQLDRKLTSRFSIFLLSAALSLLVLEIGEIAYCRSKGINISERYCGIWEAAGLAATSLLGICSTMDSSKRTIFLWTKKISSRNFLRLVLFNCTLTFLASLAAVVLEAYDYSRFPSAEILRSFHRALFDTLNVSDILPASLVKTRTQQDGRLRGTPLHNQRLVVLTIQTAKLFFTLSATLASCFLATITSNRLTLLTPKKPPSLPGSRRPSLSIGDRVRSISVYVNDFIGEIINVSESKSSPSVTPSLPPSTSAVLREEHELTITSKSPARISVVDMAVNVVRNRRISRTHTPLHEIHLADLNPGHERREANGNEQQ